MFLVLVTVIIAGQAGKPSPDWLYSLLVTVIRVEGGRGSMLPQTISSTLTGCISSHLLLLTLSIVVPTLVMQQQIERGHAVFRHDV